MTVLTVELNATVREVAQQLAHRGGQPGATLYHLGKQCRNVLLSGKQCCSVRYQFAPAGTTQAGCCGALPGLAAGWQQVGLLRRD